MLPCACHSFFKSNLRTLFSASSEQNKILSIPLFMLCCNQLHVFTPRALKHVLYLKDSFKFYSHIGKHDLVSSMFTLYHLFPFADNFVLYFIILIFSECLCVCLKRGFVFISQLNNGSVVQPVLNPPLEEDLVHIGVGVLIIFLVDTLLFLGSFYTFLYLGVKGV